MASIGELTVEIKPDTTEFEATLARIIAAFDQVTTAFADLLNQLQEGTDGA